MRKFVIVLVFLKFYARKTNIQKFCSFLQLWSFFSKKLVSFLGRQLVLKLNQLIIPSICKLLGLFMEPRIFRCLEISLIIEPFTGKIGKNCFGFLNSNLPSPIPLYPKQRFHIWLQCCPSLLHRFLSSWSFSWFPVYSDCTYSHWFSELPSQKPLSVVSSVFFAGADNNKIYQNKRS